jgi:hypothetical protein
MQVAFRTFFSLVLYSLVLMQDSRALSSPKPSPDLAGSTTNAGPAQLLRRENLSDKWSR